MGISPLGFAVIMIVLLALAITLFVIARRTRGTYDEDRLGIRITLIGAIIVAAASTIGAAWALVAILTSPTLEMVLPVKEQNLAPVDSAMGPASIVAGPGATEIVATVAGASGFARGMWAAGHSLSWLVSAAVAALIALACVQLLRGAPFTNVLSRSTAITAFVVLIGGTLAQVLPQIGANDVAVQALRPPSAPGLEFATTFAINVSFWPFGVGISLAALATIFSIGTRLQKDTKGLV